MVGRVGIGVGVLLALLPGATSAQPLGGSERDEVLWGTTAAVLVALLLCAVGYAYRRSQGMDHPTPDELEMAGHGHGHDDDDHDAADAHTGGRGETAGAAH